MPSGLFAGLDVSTQGCKLVVIGLGQRKVVWVDAINYDTDLPQYGTRGGVAQGLEPRASESDPQMWIDAIHGLFGKLPQSGLAVKEIRCISVSGQQHGLVSLDAAGKLSRSRSKLWNDFSTLEECRILTEKVGGLEAMIAEVGNSQRTGYTAPKIYHMLRHERANYDRTATFFLVHNYINWYLTGGPNGGVAVMEPGDTSGTALWHPGKAAWSKKVINAIDPGLAKKLPPVKPSEASIGRISAELAAKYGFSPDCKIDAGTGDNMYGAVGTGNVKPGIVTVSLGTSGTACTYMKKAFIDPTGEIAAFCDSTGAYLPLLCVSNLANGYNDIVDLHNLTHQQFDNEIIKKTPVGNGGRLLIPWYWGERTPDVPQAAPICFGFGLGDFTVEVLSRAVLEGHILNLYDGFTRMGVVPTEIRLTGGLSKSDPWCQTIADVFNAEVVPVKGEGAALGAAVHAAWVWLNKSGTKTKVEDLCNSFVVLEDKRRARPIPANVKVYGVQKQLFHALSARVRGVKGDDPFALRSQLASM
jgi:xylulokinase